MLDKDVIFTSGRLLRTLPVHTCLEEDEAKEDKGKGIHKDKQLQYETKQKKMKKHEKNTQHWIKRIYFRENIPTQEINGF